MANEKEQKPKTPKEQKPKEPKEPKEPKSKEQKPKEQAPKKEDQGVLETAAEKIGATLGAIAVKTGIAHPEAQVSKKIGKLPKKNKSRLPRKMKKQARKVRGAKPS